MKILMEDVLKQFDDKSFKAILEAKKTEPEIKYFKNPSGYGVSINGRKYVFNTIEQRKNFIEKSRQHNFDVVKMSKDDDDDDEDEVKKTKPKKDKKLFEPFKGKMIEPSEDDEEDEPEPIENYAYDAVQVVQDAIEKLIPRKKIHAAATSALKQFCKSNKIDYEELVDMMGEFIYHDVDKEDMDIVSLYFLGGI